MFAKNTIALLIIVAGLGMRPESVAGQYASSHVSLSFGTNAVFGAEYSY